MGLQANAMLVAGAFAVLLMFGCLGGQGAQAQTPSGQQSAQQAGSPPQAGAASPQPGGSLGDADISDSETGDEDELPDEALVPPPVGDSASGLSDSDIDLGAMDEDYVISDEDIVEPA